MRAQLTKGFEVELFTGRPDGTVVGCSAAAAAALAGVVTEPDQRNLEYITPPDADYNRQLLHLLKPRQALRQWLHQRGLTLLPGSTLSLGDSHRFERSDPKNSYHDFIEQSYGTRVVTASVHINLGLNAPAKIFAACRLLRCEAALLLALSASSPFLDGQVSGAHSQRWLQFPLTPTQVPLFRDHGHYIAWMEAQLAAGTMRNVRHLWSSVRPNGNGRPHDLNRVELRICDLITDPIQLLAITAYAELRLLQLLDHGGHDPLKASSLSLEQLEALADANDRAAAKASLGAQLHHWTNGEELSARHWLETQLQQLSSWAGAGELHDRLQPLGSLLAEGNQAMVWLARHRAGESIGTLISKGAAAMEAQELDLVSKLWPDGAGSLG